MRRTRNISTRAAVLAAFTLLAACGRSAPANPSPSRAAQEIEEMLQESAQAWTRGDLDGFLDDYAEDATFVGSSGLIQGRERIRQSYMRGYWSTGMPASGLRFRNLAIRRVGGETAVAVGRYELFDRRTGDASSTGVFSLTLREMVDGWKIVHDHSSSDASE